jgi:hypothetical protein
MKYDRIRWNAKHAAKRGFHQADSFLLKHFNLLSPGKCAPAWGKLRTSQYSQIAANRTTQSQTLNAHGDNSYSK